MLGLATENDSDEEKGTFSCLIMSCTNGECAGNEGMTELFSRSLGLKGILHIKIIRILPFFLFLKY